MGEIKVGDRVSFKGVVGGDHYNICGKVLIISRGNCLISVETDHVNGIPDVLVSGGSYFNSKFWCSEDFGGIMNGTYIANNYIPVKELKKMIKNTKLARKMYPNHSIEGDYLWVN